jgi:nucleoside-diphosphate-sugar epimerase
MKVMVNGATGLVGMSIVNALLEAGHDVRVSDRPGSDFNELEKLGVEIIPADLDDQPALEKTVDGMDGVVHVAGMFDFGAPADLLDKINHQGTRKVCEAVLAKAPNLKRFVQIASVGVYGKPAKCPCREDYPKRPRNPYERSKWRGEMAAFEYHVKHGLPVAALRPTLIYGPRAKYGHAMYLSGLTLYKINISDKLFTMRNGPKTSHVHVEDVGRAAVLLVEKDEAVGNSYNIADPNPLEGIELIHALADPIGLEVKNILPLNAPMMSIINAAVGATPGMPIRMINKRLALKWQEIQETYGVTADITPRLDTDWIGYMTGDNYYDITAIKNLGMEWKWPDAVAGIKATYDWYQKMEWLP